MIIFNFHLFFFYFPIIPIFHHSWFPYSNISMPKRYPIEQSRLPYYLSPSCGFQVAASWNGYPLPQFSNASHTLADPQNRLCL
jgi:hypothetical protein